MAIQSGIKTPGIYTDVNLNAQRTGLPANVHKVLLLSDDTPEGDMRVPVNVFDKNDADAKFGAGSVMGRMMSAAIKTNRLVNTQGYVLDADLVAGQSLTTEENDPLSTEGSDTIGA